MHQFVIIVDVSTFFLYIYVIEIFDALNLSKES